MTPDTEKNEDVGVNPLHISEKALCECEAKTKALILAERTRLNASLTDFIRKANEAK